MLTYCLWKSLTDFDYDEYTIVKLACYMFLAMMIIPTIAVDILISPFEIIALIIYFIQEIALKLKARKGLEEIIKRERDENGR